MNVSKDQRDSIRNYKPGKKKNSNFLDDSRVSPKNQKLQFSTEFMTKDFKKKTRMAFPPQINSGSYQNGEFDPEILISPQNMEGRENFRFGSTYEEFGPFDS